MISRPSSHPGFLLTQSPLAPIWPELKLSRNVLMILTCGGRSTLEALNHPAGLAFSKGAACSQAPIPSGPRFDSRISFRVKGFVGPKVCEDRRDS